MTDLKPFETSGRRDPIVWLLLWVGLIFAAFGFAVTPGGPCISVADCMPWPAFVAKWAGALVMLVAFGQMVANKQRGCRIDPESGDLIWWKNRSATHDGQSGRIHPARISRLAILYDSDGAAEISLQDLDGQRQPWFDTEVLPLNVEGWARALVARYPHIRLEISG
jgi:hypothetical protein